MKNKTVLKVWSYIKQWWEIIKAVKMTIAFFATFGAVGLAGNVAEINPYKEMFTDTQKDTHKHPELRAFIDDHKDLNLSLEGHSHPHTHKYAEQQHEHEVAPHDHGPWQTHDHPEHKLEDH